MTGTTGQPAVEPAVARYARVHLRRSGPRGLFEALHLLDRLAPRPLSDEAWAAAGVGRAFAEMLAEAQQVSGRAITDLTFLLHQRIAINRAPHDPPIAMHTLEPYMPWIDAIVAGESAWRAVLTQWIDILNARLTMHRYSSQAHRRLQARSLVGRPLLLMARKKKAEFDDPEGAVEEFADDVLMLWDLLTVNEQVALGWNRIHPPSDEPMGGFYGLADQARPPTAQAIREGVERLIARLEALDSSGLPNPLDGWIESMRARMLRATHARLQGSEWPEAWHHPPEKTWLDRLGDWVRGESS